MIEVEPERFEEMVREALDGLSADLGRILSNVAVTVDLQGGRPGLLGLYQGIPLTGVRPRTAAYCPIASRSTAGRSARAVAARRKSSTRFAGR